MPHSQSSQQAEGVAHTITHTLSEAVRYSHNNNCCVRLRETFAAANASVTHGSFLGGMLLAAIHPRQPQSPIPLLASRTRRQVSVAAAGCCCCCWCWVVVLLLYWHCGTNRTNAAAGLSERCVSQQLSRPALLLNHDGYSPLPLLCDITAVWAERHAETHDTPTMGHVKA